MAEDNNNFKIEEGYYWTEDNPLVLVFEKIQIKMIFSLKKIIIKYYKNCNNIPNHITKAVTVMLVKNNLWINKINKIN